MEPTKISFNKTAFISSFKNHLQQLESETDAKLKSLMTTEAKQQINSGISELSTNFRDLVNIYTNETNKKTVPKNKFPDELYTVIMNRVVNIEAPKISGGTNNEGAIIKLLGSYIADLLDNKKESVTIGGTTYILSNDFGSTNPLVTVEIKGSNEGKYIFSWNDDTKTRESFNSFMEKTTAFAEERLTTGIFTALIEDAKKSSLVEAGKDLLSLWSKPLLSGKKLAEFSKMDDIRFFHELALYKEYKKTSLFKDITEFF